MATTTNFGWETPDDTDLVKDGAAAMRTLGGAIDTSLVDLKGGTTGQSLLKNSNTDMDFVWSTPISPAKSYSLLSTTTLTGAATITVSSLSGYDNLLFLISGWDCGTASTDLEIRFNGDTGTNYRSDGFSTALGATYDRQLLSSSSNNSTRLNVGTLGTVVGGGANGSTAISMTGCNSSGVKVFTYISGTLQNTTSTMVRTRNGMGVWSNSAVVSSISLISTAGNFNGGTVRIYGAA